jgi:hypothetical protein
MTTPAAEAQPFPILFDNGKREILKLIAIITMVVDHVGIVVFSDNITLRLIGRISFPIFALLLAEGFIRTKHPRQYATRLFIFFLISQVPFVYALGYPEYLNIFLDLFIGFLLLWSLKNDRLVIFGPLFFAGVAVPPLFGYSLNYEWYGLLTIVLAYLYFTRRIPATGAYGIFALITFLLVALGQASIIQVFAVFSPLLVYGVLSSTLTMKRMPKYIYYAFYPAHLILLWLLFR